MYKRAICTCASLLFFTLTVFAQQGIVITGVITDADGETLPGASVRVVGTAIGDISNADGVYRITVPNAESILLFTFMGHLPVEITVGSQRIINVQMETDAAQISEVVVIGYGTQARESITSAISSVQTSELLKSPTTSLGNALAGRLPGFSAIQYSGLPGHDDPTVYIRGVGTLSEGNSRPLILVDGVERDFTQIDPNEVADISILKDAGATAVFGVRGANGVILVTTRRGETGRARVSASASIGLQQPVKIVNFAGSYLYANTFNDAQRRDGISPDRFAFTEEALTHFRLGDQPVLYPSVDWMSYILKDHAWQNQFNINVSGGNDRAKYFVSVSRLFQDGLFETFAADPRENYKYNRYNYRANLDINLTSSTLLSVSLGGRVEDRNSTNHVRDSADGSNPEAGIFRYLVEAAPMSGAGIVDGKRITYNQQLNSLSFARDGLTQYYARGFRNEVANVLNFDLTLTQQLDFIVPGLNVKFKGAYNNRYVLEKVRPTHNSGLMGVSSYIPHPLRDPVTGAITGHVLEKATESQVLEYNENYSYGRDWYFDFSFNYSRRIAESHNVSALLLYNQTKRYYPSSYTDIPRGYLGMVARVTYDYRLKYMVDLNMGYNGSENFIEGKRYGFFPSASVGWTVTEESFMKQQNTINYLKLRYSFGIVGSEGSVGRFVYTPASYATGMPPRGSGSGLSGTFFGYRGETLVKPNVNESNIGNPNVSWEKARKQNIGVDIRTLDNRLGVYFDYFWEHRWDILVSPSASIPAYFALPNVPAINYGIVDNKGYEISVSWSDRVGSDFRYTIAPNMSFSRNKRVLMSEIPPAEPYLRATGTKVGQPFRFIFYDYYYPGIEDEYIAFQMSRPNAPDKPIRFPEHGTTLRPGDAVYLDLNYDGHITTDDREAVGYPNYPEFVFGLNMSFRYKRFELSMLWIGATNTNRDMAGNFREPFGGMNNGALIKWVAENSWTEDNPNARLPRITFSNKNNNTRESTIYLVDSSYARLKNLELGYSFNMQSVSYIESLRLFATGYNLITFTNYTSNDPETSGAGWGEFFRYPPTRVYNVGFRLSF